MPRGRAVSETLLRRQLSELRERIDESEGALVFETRDPAYHAFLQTVQRVAVSDSVVLLRGESGTGKNVLARWMRDFSSELVAVASHELKTSLTSLRMNLLLLRERADNLTPWQSESLAVAVDAVEELSGTIDESLDLTRIEAGQLRLQREQVDLAVVMEQAVRSLRPRFEDAVVHLRIVSEVPTAVVRGDAARLRIVLANLLDNALKYTPPGGEVHVCLASSQDTPPRLRISVTDTGPGIPAEFRERIFEKFFRVEHHQEGKVEGVHGRGHRFVFVPPDY